MDINIFSKYLLPLVLGMIMFNLGLTLTFNDFRRIFKSPKALTIGLVCQMILLPLIAFLLAWISGLPPAIKIGLVIIAACPGGATSNLITYLLKGDVALSISLTAINSILILFSIPGITYLALEVFHDDSTMISLPVIPTILKILLMIIAPTFLGMLVRRAITSLAVKLEKYLKYLTTVLLAIVFIFTVFDNNSDTRNSLNLYLSTAPYAFALNMLGMLSGYLAGRFAGFKKGVQISLVIEVGIQNSALAIAIASSQVFLGNPRMAIPGVIYGLFTFFNAVIFGYIIKRWFR